MLLPCLTHSCLHPPRRLSRPSGYYYSITVVIIVVTVSSDCSCADHLGSDVTAAMSSIAVITVDVTDGSRSGTVNNQAVDGEVYIEFDDKPCHEELMELSQAWCRREG